MTMSSYAIIITMEIAKLICSLAEPAIEFHKDKLEKRQNTIFLQLKQTKVK